MKKIIIRIVIALAILVVIGLACVFLFINSIVKTAIVTVGPQVAKVNIQLDGVSLSLFSGQGELKGLVVGNPEGCKTPNAVKVGRTSLSLQPSSLTSDKIIIRSIQVQGPEITLEGGPTKNNLTKILDNIKAFTGADKQPAQAGGKKAEKKLQVDEFSITDAKVALSLDVLGGKTVTVTLPDIRFQNLGQDEKGITAPELVEKAMAAVVDGAGKAAVNAVANMGKAIGDTVKDPGKAAGDALDKATKGIGDIFKPK